VEAPIIGSEKLQHFQGFFHNFPALYITFQVMAVADVSPGDHYAVSTRFKSIQQETVIDPA
jgi:hypothetical protein